MEEKKKMGRPPKNPDAKAEDTPRTVVSEEDVAITKTISSAAAVDEKEWEKVYLDIKSRGNYYDLARRMRVYELPKPCLRAQEKKKRKYAWFEARGGRLEEKCDSSQLFYWTPVNKTNHPTLPKHLFNKNGGIYKAGQYLTYMPWKMYEAYREMLDEISKQRYQELEDMTQKEGETAAHFDPTEGGTKSAATPGDVVYEAPEIEHPQESFSESGEYVG